MDLGLKDKRVFVAGGSRGIGLAIARAFVDEGAKVAIAARGREDLAAAEKSLAGVLALTGDMTDDKAVNECLDRTEKQVGPLDILVANVGNGTSTGGAAIASDEWQRMMAVNFFGAASLAVSAGRRFAERGQGAMVFISSIAGVESIGAPAAYAASKAALQSMVKSFSAELGPKGVRVNAVAPGNVLFPGGSWERKNLEAPDKVERMLASEVPLRRLGAPGEIADVVLFLSSRRASFVTGATWVVDGGQTRKFI